MLDAHMGQINQAIDSVKGTGASMLRTYDEMCQQRFASIETKAKAQDETLTGHSRQLAMLNKQMEETRQHLQMT